ncbi:MAG: hypothetical protein C0407_10570, partial [Desulfobacca sp.]|nr:hypothetical protein [Desulfobacca sp.]
VRRELFLTSILSIGLFVQTVRTLKELEPHAEAWNNLAFQAPHQLPDLSYAWSASYLEHQLESGESWFCLFVYDRSTLVGVLPVVVTPLKRMGLSRRKFRTPYNDQTASIDFLVEPGREEEIIPLLLAQLHQIDPGWFSFELRHLPECSPTLGLMNRGIKGIKSIAVPDGRGCFVRARGSVKKFEEQLRPNFKKKLRKAEHRFLALRDPKISFVSGEALSDQDLLRFRQVESASWKFTKGSTISQSPSLVSFFQALTRRLKDLGWLEWQFLEAEGKPIAALMTIRVNRSLVALKICFDEAYAVLSPGITLLAKTVERAFSSGRVDEVNFLTDYPWFSNWPIEKRAYYNVFIFPSRPFPLLTGYLWLKMCLKGRQISATRRLYDVWMKIFKGYEPAKDPD